MTRRDEQIRRILEEIGRGAATSHRELSARVGLSLGLTNQLLQLLLQRQFVRVVHVSGRRRQYMLTELGAEEHARMARSYRRMAVSYYADVRDSIRGRFEELSRHWPSSGPEKRIVLYGSGDLAEIAFACAQGTDLKIIGVVDETAAPSCCGCTVQRAEQLVCDGLSGEAFDGVVVVTCDESTAVRSRLEALGVPATRVRWL